MNKLKIDIVEQKKQELKSLYMIRVLSILYSLFILFLAIFLTSWLVVIYFLPLVIMLFIEQKMLMKIRGEQ